MQSDESAVAVALRKLSSRVERDADRRGVGLNQDIRYDCPLNKVGPLTFVFGIVITADVGIRPSIEAAIFNGRDVVGHKIVTKRVPFVDRDPDGIGAGIERQANGISNSGSEDAVARVLSVLRETAQAMRNLI